MGFIVSQQTHQCSEKHKNIQSQFLKFIKKGTPIQTLKSNTEADLNTHEIFRTAIWTAYFSQFSTPLLFVAGQAERNFIEC